MSRHEDVFHSKVFFHVIVSRPRKERKARKERVEKARKVARKERKAKARAKAKVARARKEPRRRSAATARSLWRPWEVRFRFFLFIEVSASGEHWRCAFGFSYS